MVDGKHAEKRNKKIRRLDIKAGLLGFFMFCRFWTQRVSRNGVASGGDSEYLLLIRMLWETGFSLDIYIYIHGNKG